MFKHKHFDYLFLQINFNMRKAHILNWEMVWHAGPGFRHMLYAGVFELGDEENSGGGDDGELLQESLG